MKQRQFGKQSFCFHLRDTTHCKRTLRCIRDEFVPTSRQGVLSAVDALLCVLRRAASFGYLLTSTCKLNKEKK